MTCGEKYRRQYARDKTREEAEAMERSNLGYWAGYYGRATRERVESLFRCAHPIFGAIAVNGPPTAEELFELGLRLGREHETQSTSL